MFTDVEGSTALTTRLGDSAARELIEPAAVAGRDAGSRFQLTIWVDDADAACAELATRGVDRCLAA